MEINSNLGFDVIFFIFSCVVNCAIAFLSYYNKEMRKIWEKQLELVYSPLLRELECVSIECSNTKEFVDNLYKIVYDNYMYVSFEISDSIISLKKKCNNADFEVTSSDEDYVKLDSNITYGYYDLQNKLKFNSDSSLYGKLTILHTLKLLSQITKYLLMSIPLIIFVNIISPFIEMYYILIGYLVLSAVTYILVHLSDKQVGTCAEKDKLMLKYQKKKEHESSNK